MLQSGKTAKQDQQPSDFMQKISSSSILVRKPKLPSPVGCRLIKTLHEEHLHTAYYAFKTGVGGETQPN
jgi:hypothetical protein